MQEVSINARWKWINLFAAYERRDNTITQVPMVYNNEGIMLMKQANLPAPVRNLAIFLSANPTWGVYSPRLDHWRTEVLEYNDLRRST